MDESARIFVAGLLLIVFVKVKGLRHVKNRILLLYRFFLNGRCPGLCFFAQRGKALGAYGMEV